MKEINKHTLIEAIASLPDHEPPAAVWAAIGQELVLQKGLNDLEEYEPPAAVWTTIQNDLVLQKSVGEMPQYEPPGFVWEQISAGLPVQKIQQKGRVVSFNKWVQRAAAAVLIGFLAVFGWNQLGTAPTNAEELTYSTISVSDDLLKKDWNDDEDAFEYLWNICKEKVLACENPEFKSLKMELEELNDAKAMLEEAIGRYGTDADLIAQIREIEFARTDIVKKMIENVI